MRFARDFNGFLIDAENNKSHGDFICPLCHSLSHWRKTSVDQRRPHFYHAEANDDCQLSVPGGKWTQQDTDNVQFCTEDGVGNFNFSRKADPGLIKVPLDVISGSDTKNNIFPSAMIIQLSSPDLGQLDSNLSVFSDFVKTKKGSQLAVIPLPVKFVGREPARQRIHGRLINISGSTPKLVEELSVISIPKCIDISIRMPERVD